MELKEFIKQVLVDISEGIEDAQLELRGTAFVAPRRTSGKDSSSVYTTHGYLDVSNVDFDVAVTSESSEKNTDKVSGGVRVFDFVHLGGGLKGENSILSQNVSRVKFSIPMIYPTSDLTPSTNKQKLPKRTPPEP